MSDVLVLCYHAVSERWPAPLSVTPERLEHQLEFLLRNGYQGTTFTRAVTNAPRGKVLAVTFDDGFRSVATMAAPIMRRLGIPGTLFAATSHMGTEQPMVWSGLEQWVGTRYETELMGSSWAELEGLARTGWEIGAHTRTHPHLTQLDDASIYAELADSRSDIEQRLGGTCTSLAYPYGDHDVRVVAAAAKAGFLAACTLPRRLHRPEPLRFPRIYVGHRDAARSFRLKVSPQIRATRVAGAIVGARLSAGRRGLFSRGA
jgi:peptidoglycan/xylan/chitin deacetylase (PgdA/CDA1 family)